MPGPNQRNPLAAFMTPAVPGQALAGARLLPLDLVDPNPAQSRQVFDEGTLTELAASIAEHGVLQPIVVRPVGTRYQIVAGERRSRAARQAGLVEIPAIIREMTDAEAAYATAIENLQREDLDLEDEARQYQTLLTLTGLSQRSLAAQLGVSHNYIAERVRLLDRPDLLAAYRAGTLTLRQALLALREPVAPPPAVIRDYTEAGSRAAIADDTLPDDSSVIPDYSPGPGAPVERAALDHRTGAVRGGDLQRTPWRERPLSSFMDWVARVDVTTVPAQELETTLDQLAEARNWLYRLELQLQERKNRESE